MEDLPIGSEITLKVVEDKETKCRSCDGCFFNELSRDLHDDFCANIKCLDSERADGKCVKFIRKE